MPIPAITTRSLGAGRPSAPRTEAGTIEGRAMSAAEAFKNERRVIACEVGLFLEAIFMQLFVNFLQRRFCLVAQAVIGGVVRHSLQSFPGSGRLTACQRFGDLF